MPRRLLTYVGSENGQIKKWIFVNNMFWETDQGQQQVKPFWKNLS